MKLLARLFLSSYSPVNDNFQAIKTFTLTLVLLIPLILTVNVISNAGERIVMLIYAMAGLNLFALWLIRAGRYKLAIPVMLVGLSILASGAVFSLKTVTPLEVFMLTAIHLFLIFTTAMVSYDKRVAFLGTAMAIASFTCHYFFRGLASYPTQTWISPILDNYVICTGLVLLSCGIITTSIRTRDRLFKRLTASSKGNAEKAAQLTRTNKDLVEVMASREEIEQKYRLMLETATDAISIVQDGLIKFSNSRTVEMFGYTMEELLETPFANILHPDDRELVTRRYRERLDGKMPPPSYTFRAIDKSGNTRWLQLHTVFTTWEGNPAGLNFIQDITDHKLMEHQIQQSQKMEAIGTLAGGIAHDFNNILSGIFAYIQLAQNHLNDPERIKRDLQKIRAGAEKAADLSRQILMVSRKSEPKREVSPITPVVREVLDLIRATLPATIEIRDRLETDAPVLADPGKLHQVAMNLCTNAYQAMAESGGILSVSLSETRVFQDPELAGRGIPPGEYICLTVTDTGQGMDLETQEKVFDPYFTTKAPGKGTGLGMAVVLGIVREHNGYIRVFSERGKGSEFHLFFPRAEGDAPAETSGDPEPPITRGQGHILFVDDESHLCLATRELLSDQGFEVTCVENGASAWAAFTDNPGRFDLVLTDYTMPVMSGSELTEKIKSIAPETPIILCTGNTEIIAAGRAPNVDVLIPKPVEIDRLLKAVHSLLGKQSAGVS